MALRPEWPTQIRDVYVLCHPEKEKDRYEKLIPHLVMSGIPVERLHVCAPTWGDTITNDLMFKVYDPFLRPQLCFKGLRLLRGEVSLVLNFYSAVKNSLKDLSGNEAILVLESDVILRRDFLPRLGDLMRDVSGANWDYISLSEGVGTRPPGAPASYYAATKAYEPPHRWVFRCTDSMILHRRFLEKLSTTLLPFKECLDWELNFQMLQHGGRALWADPPLVEQGTCFGRGASTLF